MPQTNDRSEFYAIDLFAGGGGLTVGLKRGGFRVVSAVEIEINAYSTYKTNHPEVNAFKQDVRTVRGDSLKELSPNGHINLIAGCPPCQGFTSLTSKYKSIDPRNELILEMARLVREILPDMVMMENVPGLRLRGQPLFNEFLRTLSECGYVVSEDVLQVADYGVPQNRRRLVLLAGKGFAPGFPPPTHARVPSASLLPWRSVREQIGELNEPVALDQANLDGGPEFFNWHVVRNLSPINDRRLAKAKPGKSWTGIPKRLRPQCHKDNKAGFSNVYGRMSWDQISPTITGGCTTLSKGRFGHPEKQRTISVREAALLQTFPTDYIFSTPFMEHACNIVGNALPCQFAESMAMHCRNVLVGQKLPPPPIRV